MGLVGGHRRRARTASFALLFLVLAGGAVTGLDDDAAARVTRTAPAAAPPQAATMSTTGEMIRALRGSPDLDEPAPPARSDDRPGGRVVHLTFDDGPVPRHTKPILDLLDRHDARATFFVVGENAVEHPELTRMVVERGHALGNHTWTHPDMRTLGPARLNGQIARTSRVLGAITGEQPTCLRPPFGAVNRRVRSAVRGHDLSMRLWDIDPRDWQRPSAAVIAARVVSRARQGAVVLMHDGGGNRVQSVRALRLILRGLGEKGYSFVPLPGC